ncbi:cytochrome C oxidase subunit III [Pajaroellobacter abortibovis]|uniref:Cytochrome C oxidase subunit III n=2 Tax=Pajaroellobacter abortibovis TaxID=1882918 RepID=A0A1L6MZ48_9BACT|nr:cytochrome C oxidase subunit III [Pajaroellobacter abortibovis]
MPPTQGEHAHEHPKWLAHHFDTPFQQFDAAKLGMWVFIVTEVLMLGGLFVAYALYRSHETSVFVAAHHCLDKTFGVTNTVVLLLSSLTAALAVRSAQVGERSKTSLYLVITLLCACIFLGIKCMEYSHKVHEGLLPGHYFGHPYFDLNQTAHWYESLPARASMFFGLYFMMTGLHGLHVLIGMGILIWVLRRNIRGDFDRNYFTAVDIGALYWHLVDLVWIYLFPLLYLIE